LIKTCVILRSYLAEFFLECEMSQTDL